MDEVDELTEVVEFFEEEADLAGKLDGLDEVDGLPEEETDSEDGFSAAELVPDFTASPFVALQPAASINSADRQIKNSLLHFIMIHLINFIGIGVKLVIMRVVQ